jgi:uncharacterized iron-regulated membrane protein
MLTFRRARLALAAVFLCGFVRPAFADGALGGLEAFGEFLEVVLVLFALGIVALIALAIHKWRKRQAEPRTRNVGSPELPEARAMNERSRSGPKQ